MSRGLCTTSRSQKKVQESGESPLELPRGMHPYRGLGLAQWDF